MSNIVEISGLVWMTNMIRLKQDWHVGNQVGSGGFSKVFAAQSESGELSVVKLIPKSHGADREILFGSLKDLSDVPNVMPIIDRGEWGDSLVLVMPKADYSLRDFIGKSSGRITVENALQVLHDIAEALAAIEGAWSIETSNLRTCFFGKVSGASQTSASQDMRRRLRAMILGRTG